MHLVINAARGCFLCAHRRTSFRVLAALIIFRNAGLRSLFASEPTVRTALTVAIRYRRNWRRTASKNSAIKVEVSASSSQERARPQG
jgi:hypothetical protein